MGLVERAAASSTHGRLGEPGIALDGPKVDCRTFDVSGTLAAVAVRLPRSDRSQRLVIVDLVERDYLHAVNGQCTRDEWVT